MFQCGFTFGKLSECDIKSTHNACWRRERTRLIGEMVWFRFVSSRLVVLSCMREVDLFECGR